MIQPVMTALVSLSLLVSAIAQQEPQKTQKNDSPQPDQTERANKLGQQGADEDQRADLPESLKQLDLSDQQKEKLLGIYRDSDRKSQQLWDRVQELHRQAISMEAAVIAAARLEGHDHNAHEGQASQPTSADQNRKPDSAETGKSSIATSETEVLA